MSRKAIPEGFTAVTPHLVCKNAAAAIDYPFGHNWAVAQKVKNLTPEQVQQAFAKAF